MFSSLSQRSRSSSDLADLGVMPDATAAEDTVWRLAAASNNLSATAAEEQRVHDSASFATALMALVMATRPPSLAAADRSVVEELSLNLRCSSSLSLRCPTCINIAVEGN